MVSRENLVVGLFVLSALPAAWAVERLTGTYELSFLVLLVVGVGLPSLVNGYLKKRRRP